MMSCLVNNKLYSQIIFIFIALSLQISINAFAASVDDASIRLPAMTRYWKSDDSTNMPAISMEEIDKCIGNDVNIRKQFNAYQEASEKIDAESKELEKQINSLTAEREAIQAEGALVDAEIVKMNDKNAQIDNERVQVAALSSNKKMDATASKNANLKINAFNNKVNQLNVEHKLLKGRIQMLMDRQKKFTQITNPIKEKSDIFNEKLTQFKVQQAEFEKMIISSKESCSGPREVVK